MSRKELKRVGVMMRVETGELQLVDAAELMGLSYRQTIRVRARYEAEGPEGLKHRNAGRPSNRAKPRKFRETVLGLVRKKYGGGAGERFGPTLAAEHLEADDGQKVDHETLRRWMLEEGSWSLERKRKAHRRRRERKEHFGELVQLDGSFEEWLEGSGETQCLMNMVDDASSKTLSQLHEQETTWAAVDVLRAWIEKYGIPHCLYTDWKNVYLRQPNAKERLTGEEASRQAGIRADVPEAGGEDPGGQFAAGQGASGAQQRNATRPAHQETAAVPDWHDAGSQPVSAATLPAPASRGGLGTSPGAPGKIITARVRAKRSWMRFSGWSRNG